jgi:hypothetical protein
MDIGGHPPFPTGSKQVFWQFWQFTIFSSFHFRGHFEGLNEGFWDQDPNSMIAKGMIEAPK